MHPINLSNNDFLDTVILTKKNLEQYQLIIYVVQHLKDTAILTEKKNLTRTVSTNYPCKIEISYKMLQILFKMLLIFMYFLHLRV